MKWVGATALDSHRKGQKHQHLDKTPKKDAIGTLFSPQSSSKSSQSSTANAVWRRSPREVSLSLPSFVVDENTLNVEIMWCFNVVKSHYCFRSCDSLKNLFKCLFPDSAIREKFCVWKGKARYSITYGIFPAFKQKLKSIINDCSWLSISFDESLNRNQQKC